jgi:hypothetical protein
MGEFQQIEFGFTDAHTESAEAPRLLRDGFLDDGLVDRALTGRHFLFLGYKGSGKTAIAERARLLAEADPQLFVKVATLDEFSYGDFKSAAGSTEPQARYPTVWKWLLLVALFGSLEEDEGGKAKAAGDYPAVARALRKLNLIPTPQFNDLVVKSSKKNFKVALPKILGFENEREYVSQDLNMAQAVSSLEQAVCQFPTRCRHVLFLDGLDEILGGRDLQFQALSALMAAASRLNNLFRSEQVLVKIVILCRTDIFDRLPGANINKLRQDHSESLQWFDDPAHPDQTRLVQMVNLRAQLSLGREVNVFSEFFPKDISDRDTRKEVLDHTRHTPRDVIRLFSSIQRFARTGSVLTPKQVRSGFREFSIDYFLPEIRNEMHGYLPPDAIHKAEQVLREHGDQYFTQEHLLEAGPRIGVESLDVKTATQVLFDCSAIGYIENRNGMPIRTMKYRNPHAQLTPGKKMWLHPGVCRALNIQPGSPVAYSENEGMRSRRRTRKSRRGRRKGG